ncbi:PAS domain-containing sensor histidine kinase [Synechocystis sp. PCC 7509]|uniref:PAS domain-containing sensor histidine kinase n=1 Tax=Synechocystis sp. PCC 7509 TaxID=927677 RepID=UPI0002ACFF68|nr:ATP-binding protein [Synechocystis sp. PCC 7509]
MQNFVQKIDAVRDRAAKLQNQASTSSSQPQQLIPQALAELETALEELRVAEEEMRRQNEQLAIASMQIQSERQRYQDLFEFAPDGYLVTDCAGLIREINHAAAKLLNAPQDYLISKPLTNYVQLEQRKAFRTQLNQLHHTDKLTEWEVSICPRRAATIDVGITVAINRDNQGRAKSLRWLMREITARKLAEETLRQTQLQNLQLQETARLKSHFLAIMSHELRTPMNAIVGFSQLLLRQKCPPLAKSQENMVEIIFNNGKHLLKLIEDILQAAKIESNSLEIVPQEFNLAEIINDIKRQYCSLIKQKGLGFEVSLSLNNAIMVNDSDFLRQVLVNLLSNAIKFTEIGGVKIKAWELPTNKIAISISDTGIGIAPEDIKHIFAEFHQLNQTITRQHGGTGLGLAICDRLVALMGGQISVDSKPNQGSSFTITLPRQVKSN